MSRRLTGFTPSGNLHLGNYIGAIRPIIAHQHTTDTVVFVSDLHALTLDHDPSAVRRRTLEFATLLLAAGADPDTCLFLVQSHVPQHTELHYLLECVTGYGEAQRMIQFKEKAGRQEQVRVSLLTYPILMAADILLYDTEEVPVGADQRQHVELARDVATRFNSRYGRTFTVPEVVHPPVAARIMDLSVPTAKMSKSTSGESGALLLLDPPDALRRKVMRALSDEAGVANLRQILVACTGSAGSFAGNKELKEAVAEAVIATLGPIRERYLELAADPAHVQDVLRAGSARARQLAARKVAAVREAIGLLAS